MYKRLQKESDVQKVFTQGRNFCCKEICVRSLRNEQPVSRFAFLCGKKNLPLAVSRNTMRRRMRESIRKREKEILPGTDIVLVFRGKKKILFPEVCQNVESALRMANLLKKNNG